MLRKMLFQGLAAAVLIAGAGAIYGVYASDAPPVEIAQANTETAAPTTNGDGGYLAQNPARADRKHADRAGHDEQAQGQRRERHQERRGDRDSDRHGSDKNR